jgi:hypothetical protein
MCLFPSLPSFIGGLVHFFRLPARRFRKQIFLSVDVPPTFLSISQGSKLLLEVEKGIVEILKEMENGP